MAQLEQQVHFSLMAGFVVQPMDNVPNQCVAAGIRDFSEPRIAGRGNGVDDGAPIAQTKAAVTLPARANGLSASPADSSCRKLIPNLVAIRCGRSAVQGK